MTVAGSPSAVARRPKPPRRSAPAKRGEEGAASFVPTTRSLARVAEAAKACKGCDLYAHATQTVFGSGTTRAALIVVGEQPGDEEDRAGKPFVGPAGRVLDDLMREAGIDRRRVYVTNAVKHFKWEPRGKRRLHSRPNAAQIAACHRWLAIELGLVRAPVVVCLGATAARSILGASFQLTKSLGTVADHEGRKIIATYHPSAVLRMPDHAAREEARGQLRRDLERAWRLATSAPPK